MHTLPPTAAPRPVDLATLIRRLQALAEGEGRSMVAIAGPPAAGKSTLAAELAARIAECAPGRVAVLPMDGFHLDDGVLRARGWLARKGAPQSFDLDGFASVLTRLATGTRAVAVPLFDRGLELARAGARIIAPEARLVLVEGNYLLLDAPGWRELRAFFCLSVFLDLPEETLRARLQERWKALPPAEAEARIERNDLRNARLVRTCSQPADLVLRP